MHDDQDLGDGVDAPGRGRRRLVSIACGAALVAVLLLLLALGEAGDEPARDRRVREVASGPATARSGRGTGVTTGTPGLTATTAGPGGDRAGDPGAPGGPSAGGPGAEPPAEVPPTGGGTTVPGPDDDDPPAATTTTSVELPVPLPELTVPTLPEVDVDLELSDLHIGLDLFPVGSDGAPRLTWSAQGAVAVSVEGLGFASTLLSGEGSLCPGAVVFGLCAPLAGSHTYLLTARDAQGNEVERSVTLTVG
jgi:hypothetical protein